MPSLAASFHIWWKEQNWNAFVFGSHRDCFCFPSFTYYNWLLATTLWLPKSSFPYSLLLTSLDWTLFSNYLCLSSNGLFNLVKKHSPFSLDSIYKDFNSSHWCTSLSNMVTVYSSFYIVQWDGHFRSYSGAESLSEGSLSTDCENLMSASSEVPKLNVFWAGSPGKAKLIRFI